MYVGIVDKSFNLKFIAKLIKHKTDIYKTFQNIGYIVRSPHCFVSEYEIPERLFLVQFINEHKVIIPLGNLWAKTKWCARCYSEA